MQATAQTPRALVGSVGRMGTPNDIEAVVIWLGVNPSRLMVTGVKPGRRIPRHVKRGNESKKNRAYAF